MKCKVCGVALKGIQIVYHSRLAGCPTDMAELYCDNIECAKFGQLAWPDPGHFQTGAPRFGFS